MALKVTIAIDAVQKTVREVIGEFMMQNEEIDTFCHIKVPFHLVLTFAGCRITFNLTYIHHTNLAILSQVVTIHMYTCFFFFNAMKYRSFSFQLCWVTEVCKINYIY